jgi:transposase
VTALLVVQGSRSGRSTPGSPPTLFEKVRHVRELRACGLTQREIAGATGMSLSVVQRLTGRTRHDREARTEARSA